MNINFMDPNIRKDKIEDTKGLDEITDVPSTTKAIDALEVAFKWLERQKEIDTIHLLQLKQIRDLIEVKRNTNLYQTIMSYFNDHFIFLLILITLNLN